MHTYVNFAGRCAEAFRYNEQDLGGRSGTMMTHGQAPDQGQVRPEWKDMILHTRMATGDTELMAADIPGVEPTRSACLTLGVDSDAEAERFAEVQDRFGIKWMVLHERLMPPRP